MPPLPPLARTCIQLHAACGAVALLSGIVALATRKGSLPHRRAGKVFAVAMLVGIVLAQPAIFVRRNLMLGLVTPFTLYMVIRGVRVIRRRDGASRRFDRALALIAAAGGVALMGRGVLELVRGGRIGGLAAVNIGFGVLAFRLGRSDLRSMSPGAPALGPKERMSRHMISMLGAYTAGVTAFTAAMIPYGTFPPALIWLTPLTIGAVTIGVLERRLRAS